MIHLIIGKVFRYNWTHLKTQKDPIYIPNKGEILTFPHLGLEEYTVKEKKIQYYPDKSVWIHINVELKTEGSRAC